MKLNIRRGLHRVLHWLPIALLLIISTVSSAQNAPTSEAQLKQEAAKYFDQEDYADAYPLYSQLLSLYPDDANYNYRVGACMLFTKPDKDKPVDYLELAIKHPAVDKLAYYYLGRAYHLNYKFDAAIRTYQHFQQVASSSELKKHPVNRLIDMCNNGKTLLNNMRELDVLVKKELSTGDYFQAYDLSANGGSVLIEPDDFKSKLDKKKNFSSVIYLSADKNKVFYASYGEDDKNGTDIYEVKRLPTGGFSKPTNLGTIINSPDDEDYPFYDEPTHTLYFSSKGHNSMGGFDVFKSEYNESNDTWSSPVNMDFPVNTPDDDILFIADTLNQTAFFASTRFSPKGSIDVYKIRIQPHRPEFVQLKGISYTDDYKNVVASKITINDLKTNQVIGVYNSSQDNGNYFMSLQNAGKFIFTVEAPGHKTQSEPVILPVQEGLTTLRQVISYEVASDKLIIKNDFQTVSDSDYLLALAYIKQKAQMEVHIDSSNNAQQNNASVQASNSVTQNSTNNTTSKNLPQNQTTSNPDNNTTQTNTSNPITTTSNNTSSSTNNSSSNPDNKTTATTNNSNTQENNSRSNNSTDQLVNSEISDAKNNAQQDEATAKSMKDDANKATEYANDKLIQAQEMQQQAQQITDNSNTISDPAQKSDSLAKAAKLRQDANELDKKAIEAFELAAQDQNQANAKKQQADEALSYSSKLDSVEKTSKSRDALVKLKAEQDSIQKQQRNITAVTTSPSQLIKQQADNTKQDSTEVAKHTDELQRELPTLQQQSQDYINQAQKTDNAQEKVALLEQAKDLSDSKKQKEKEIVENGKLEQQLHTQYVAQITESQVADSISKAALQEGTSPQVANDAGLKAEIANYTPSTNTSNVVASTNTNNTLPNNSSATTNPVNTTPANNSSNTTLNNTANNQQQTTATNNNHTNTTTENNPITNQQQTTTANNSSANTTTENNTFTNQQQTASSNNNPANTTTQNNTTTNQQQAATNTTNPANNATGNNTASTQQQNTSATNPNNQQQTASTTSPVNNNTASNQQQTNTTVINNNTGSNSGNNQQQTASSTNPVNNTTQQNTISQPNVSQTSSVYNTTPTAQYSSTSSVSTVIPTNTVQYSSPEATTANTNAATLASDAKLNSSEANDTRKEARSTKDPQLARALFHKADSLDNVATQKNLQGAEYTSNANTSQYQSNQQQLSMWQTKLANNNTDAITTAKLLIQDANYYYNKSRLEKVKADSATKPYLKQNFLDNAKQDIATALLKQQNAENIYLSVDKTLPPITASNTQTASSQQNNQTTNLTSNNPTNSASQNNTANNTANPSNNPTNTANSTNLTTAANNLNQAQNNATNTANTTNSNTTQAAQNNAANPSNTTNTNTTQIAQNNSNSSNTTNLTTATNNVNQVQNNSTSPVNTTTTNTPQTAQNNSNTSVQEANKIDSMLSANNSNSQTNAANNTNQTNTSNPVTANNTSTTTQNNSSNATRNPVNNTTQTNTSNPVTANNTTNTTTQNNPTNSTSNPDNNTAQTNTSNPVTANNTTNTTTQNNPTNSTSNPDNNTTQTNTSNPVTANNTANTTANPDNNTNQNSSIPVTANNTNSTNNTTQSNPTNTTSNPDNSTTQTNTSNPLTTNNSTSTNSTTQNNPVNTNNTSLTNTGNQVNGNNSHVDSIQSAHKIDSMLSAGNNASSNNSSATTNTSNQTNANTVGQNNTTNTNSNPTNTNSQETNNTSANNSTVHNASSLNLSASDVFDASPTSPYSESKPIPINATLPEGLIYKVQIGAFRNNIPQNLFKGIQPVTGEKTATGLTRYTAGIFRELSGAKSAESKIHSLGYKDAFIVAFLNGKRIPLTEAQQGGNANNITATTTVPENNTATTTNNNTSQLQPSNTTGVASTPVKDIKGVFYTVQIGAFQHPVTAAQLYNLKPLFSYNASNGYIRYNCGTYTEIAKASAAKQDIVSRTPIKDAFVVAYSNGERIGLTQAAQQLSGTASNNAPSTQTPPQNNIPVPDNTTVTRTVPVNPPAVNNTAPTPVQPKKDSNVVIPNTTVTSPPTVNNTNSIAYRSLSSQNIDPAGDIIVSVTIHRGTINGFAKAEDVIPAGFVATGMENQGASFKFENGKAQYVWLGLPNDSVFTISYKLTALSTVSGQQTISGRFLYTVNNEKQETPITPSVINVNGSGSAPVPITATPAPVVNTPAPIVANDTASKKVIFTVQVGAYSGPIPIDMANKLLSISNQGIHAHKEDNGIASYTVGEYPNYTSADLLKQELVKDGYPQSFIVAYYQGKKISLQQAQTLINK